VTEISTGWKREVSGKGEVMDKEKKRKTTKGKRDKKLISTRKLNGEQTLKKYP